MPAAAYAVAADSDAMSDILLLMLPIWLTLFVISILAMSDALMPP